MDTTQFHTQYAASMAAFLSQLPDPWPADRRAAAGDPFFRQCALAVWQAGGTPLSRPIPPGTTPSTPAASVPWKSCSGH